MSEIVVKNSAELSAAMASATGGETIFLANGAYGQLNVSKQFQSTVTIKAASPGDAEFSRIELSGAGNLAFEGVNADYARTLNSSNVAFSDGSFPDGMYFRNLDGLTLLGNDISGGEHALILNSVQNFQVEGNNIHDAASDLMRITGSSFEGLIKNNFLTDVAATPGMHPDAIQLFAVNGVTPHDLRFTGNVIYDDPKTGSVFGQGIFAANGAYTNLQIDNNLVAIGSPNSIFIGAGERNVLVENNTLIPWPGGGGAIIRVYGEATVRDNIAKSLLDETGTATSTGNYFYGRTDASDLFQGDGSHWSDFVPREGTAIELGSGLGAEARLTELLTGAPSVPQPEPEPEPAPEPQPQPQPEPDQSDQGSVGESGVIYRLAEMGEIRRPGDVVEIDLGAAGQFDTGTISFLFKADSVGGRQGLISRDASGYGDHFTSFVENGVLTVRFQNASEEIYLREGGISAGTEHRVHITFGNDNVQLWLDGELVEQATFDAAWTNNDEYLQIGANGWASSSGQAGYTHVLDGSIGNVAIIDTSTTPDELAAMLASGAPEPDSQPQPEPEPKPEPEPDGSVDDSAGETGVIYRLAETREIARSGDVVEIDLGAAGQFDAGTISFLFNADSVAGRQGLVSRDAYGSGDHFTSFVENGVLTVRFQTASEEVYLREGGISAGNEHRVHITFGDDSVQLWLDGELVAQAAFDATWAGNDEYLQIGANGWASSSGEAGYTHILDGSIGDLAIVDMSVRPNEFADVLDGFEGLVAADDFLL